jgi:hypothetical protein
MQQISWDFKATLQFYYGFEVVIGSRTVAMVFAAFGAAIVNHQAFVPRVFITDRFQKPSAWVRAVTRADVNVKRMQAPLAVITTCLRCRRHFPPAK